MNIQVRDRRTGQIFQEKVYGDEWLRFAYENPIGRVLTQGALTGPFFSRIMGRYYSSQASCQKIPDFIRTFSIPMDQYVEEPFENFNQFFIRKFKEGHRPFAQEPQLLPAPAEGRYWAVQELTASTLFPVKGLHVTITGLLGGLRWDFPMQGGPFVVARLCPVDYHRFHFPDDGEILESARVSGRLHSVNPIALKNQDSVFIKNERHLTLLKTKNFGKILYIEVGALGVGKIVQTDPSLKLFRRGQEKGYFLFGGSTVILCGEPGAWKVDPDILDSSAHGMESMVRLGEAIARN